MMMEKTEMEASKPSIQPSADEICVEWVWAQ